MSATPNNAGAGWSGASYGAPKSPPSGEGGQNALQALLAFACIHEQAARRRSRESSKSVTDQPPLSKDELFALDEVLHLVSQRALSITGADGVAIALAENDAIVCRASFGRIAPDRGTKLDSKAGFSGACLTGGTTVRCDDSETDVRVNAAACRVLGARSMIAVPLSARGRIVGLIEAFSSEPYGFNESDERGLNLLGELILAAIRPEEEDRLAELATRIAIPGPAGFVPLAKPVKPSPPVSAPAVVLPGPAKSAPAPAGTLSPASKVSTAAIVPEPVVPVRETADKNVSLAARARVIVDEKFTPPLREAPEKPKPQTQATSIPLPTAPDQPTIASKEEQRTSAAEISPVAESVVTAPVIAAEARPDRRPLLAIVSVAALVLVAVGLAWAIWVKVRRGEQAISANTQPAVEVKTGDTEREIILPAPAEEKPGPAAQVTGLRQFPTGDSSTVVVDLQDQVQYEAQRLDHPARIYFDLHDTKIASSLTLTERSIEVNGPVLKRVRMAQPSEGITRVVLETAEQADFSVSLDPNPYRLTIEVHKPTAAMEVASAVPASLPKPTLPKPSPAISSPTNSENLPLATKGFQVVLDAGHGGWDLGTVGKKGLLEKDLTLDIVQRMGKLVEEKLNAQVIYTRQDDSYIPLEKRAEIANLTGADIFVSVHANYSDLSTARGVETYYSNSYSSVRARTSDDDALLKQINWNAVDIRAKVTDSHKLASDIQQALCGALVATNPDLRNRGVKEAQYVVLTGTQMPAVLAEVSFVSSPEDEAHLQSSEYRERIAEALYRGLAKYREESKAKNTKLATARKPVR